MKIDIQSVVDESLIIPVLNFQNAEEGLTACEALYESGIKILEITLRHPSALASIEKIKAAMPSDCIVGAGTVTSPERVRDAINAGASFGVSPGLTPSLAQAVKDQNWPFLPGIATLSEAMQARELGFSLLKFFPAELSGGVAFLKALGSVLPDLGFCPTGGINLSNAADYLALPNVYCVGGSWLVKRNKAGSLDPADIIAQSSKSLDFLCQPD